MKAGYSLAAAVVFQTALLIYAVAVVVDLERTVTSLAASMPAETSEVHVLPSVNTGIDESRLRMVIRDELVNRVPAQARAEPASPPRRSTPGEIDAVEAHLAAIVGSGFIDQRELDLVQLEIARLDAVARRKMFTRLIGSINSGQVRIAFN